MASFSQIVIISLFNTNVLKNLVLTLVVLKFIKDKSSNTSNVLDSLLLENNLVFFLWSVTSNIFLAVDISYEIFPVKMLEALTYLFYICGVFAMLSISLTLFVKYLYFTYGYLMLEMSDNVIHSLVFALKIILLIVIFMLDQFGPIQKTPMPYMIFLEKDSTLR